MKRGLAGCMLGVFAALGCGGSTTGGAPNDGGSSGSPDAGGPDTSSTSPFVQLSSAGVDQLDLLFMIDNSASMGDKQEFLAKAVPDLLGRLINPYCTDASGSIRDANGNIYGASNAGDCSGVTAAGAGSKPEFTPVPDMHVGIVTSSLGSAGADSCPETGPGSVNPVNTQLSAHNNDQGHLITRGDPNFNPASPQEVTVTDATPSGFLAWFPSVPANQGKPTPPDPPITDPNKLVADFQEMVQGVHEYGCGLESQLESWYRFLIQPDPYATIPLATSTAGRAQLQGVDGTILQQRHDFLRPDSAVAIILLSDENDSGMDPQWYGGQGWAFNNLVFPGSPGQGGGAPHGTTTCQNTPSDPSCTSSSCAFCTPQTQADPNCGGPCNGNAAPAAAYWTGQQDNVNLRHVHMRQKYGVDAQYPVSRYVNGLTQPKVPNRACEHNSNCQDPNQANWQASSTYVGSANAICTNPLYAASLSTSTNDDPLSPTSSYCTLPPGSRTPDLVFFAAITGVPYQLLHFDPNSPANSRLTDSDWVSILGQGPATSPDQAGFTDVITGIDPHMIESNVPRGNGIPTAVCNPSNQACPDTIVGSDWNSSLQDLMFACTFPFANGLVKDCTQPQYVNACDCENGILPPLCTGATNTEQNRGKAYPGIRELALARALHDQAVVASICPQEVNDATSPVYGYRPAMSGLVDRLTSGLGTPCLPQPLPQNGANCVMLASLGQAGPESACSLPGLSVPDPTGLSEFRAQQEAAWNAAGGASSGIPDPAQFPACQVNQIPGIAPGSTCLGSSTAGWCYVTSTGACSQAIVFSQASVPPTGSTVYLHCQ